MIYLLGLSGYLFEAAPAAILAGAVYLIVCRARRTSVRPAALLLVCYGAGLLALVWTPTNLWAELRFRAVNGYAYDPIGPLFTGSYNFVPSIVGYLTGELTGGLWARTMLVGNVLLLLPLGFLTPFLMKAPSWKRALLLGLGVSSVIELVQPVFGRSCDVDDVLTNALGALLGYLLFAAFRRLRAGFRQNG